MLRLLPAVLCLSLDVLAAAPKPPAKKEPIAGSFVYSGKYAYLKMPNALVAKVRAPGWENPDAESAATVGGLKIKALSSIVKSPNDIMTATDKTGGTIELEALDAERRIFVGLGAQPTGSGGYSLKRFLRLEIPDPGQRLVILAGEERFVFTAAPPKSE